MIAALFRARPGAATAIVLVAALVGALPTRAQKGVDVAPASCDTIVLFHREGCPHCERAHAFLDELEAATPELVVERFDIQRDAALYNVAYIVDDSLMSAAIHPACWCESPPLKELTMKGTPYIVIGE